MPGSSRCGAPCDTSGWGRRSRAERGEDATDLRGLDVDERDGATRLRLKVKPGGRRDAIEGVHAGALRVQVTAAPERGKANRAVLSLLADTLDLAPTSLSLLSGETSSTKVVLIPLPKSRVLQTLQVRLGDSPAR